MGHGRDQRQIEALELDLVLEAIVRRYGFDFRQYARSSITRRVRHGMTVEGFDTLAAYLEKLIRDPACMARLIEMISVHATGMFRDPGFYAVLRQEVVPLLRTYPFVRIWHAGCSSGEEVYSMAILLHEEGIYDRCRIYATDMSDTLLARAQSGIFPLSSMQQYTARYHDAGGRQDFSQYYTADHQNAIFREPLKRNVVFSQHNLVSDSPFNEFNLVLCRNVMIYFNGELRQRVQDILHRSLAHFGILGLGMKESLRYTSLNAAYEELPGNVRLYRRVR